MAQLIDTSGVVRFEGTITGAGLGQAVRSLYSGNQVTVAPGTANLTFDSLDDGPALLDLSTPDQPLFLAGGVYAITVNWFANAPPDAGGSLNVSLYVDQAVTTNTRTTAQQSSAVGPAAGGPALTVVAIVQPGDFILVTATNTGSVASRDFTMFEATVTKLG